MRKLATIEHISALRPHPNADSLERATVRGWQVCIKKGELRAGDRCVYCEIDSVLPERPEFEFLRDRKFRIKTIRLRGELSQGICFPLAVLEVPFNDGGWSNRLGLGYWEMEWRVGQDVTELLGVTLYQPPIPACLGSDVAGPFPSFIPKTDCERIQNHPWILNDLDGLEWAATEKLNGSSGTFYWKDDALHVCSRNWELKESDRNAFWQAARTQGLADKLKGTPLAIQGELLGPGIQGNCYRALQPTLYVFDVYDWQQHRYLDFLDYRLFCEQHDLECVPLIAYGSRLRDLASILREAEGESELFPTPREGVVWRPCKERDSYRMGRVAFKAISNTFLLKQKD